MQVQYYGNTPNGSCSRVVGVWLDGKLCAVAAGGVNAVDALGNGANDGTSAENPLSGEEKVDLVWFHGALLSCPEDVVANADAL
jgi:hypothetical protein